MHHNYRRGRRPSRFPFSLKNILATKGTIIDKDSYPTPRPTPSPSSSPHILTTLFFTFTQPNLLFFSQTVTSFQVIYIVLLLIYLYIYLCVMSSHTGKKLHRSPEVVSPGCGCHRPKLSHLLLRRWPKKPTTPNSTKADSSYSWSPSESFTPTATPTTTTATSMSPTCSEAAGPSARWPVIASGRIKESVAVVKESDDPYVDFRQSMLQMIVEKEIYAKEELRELLNCFLFLNSPDHHEIIIKAFMEIWNGAYSWPVARPEKKKKNKDQR